VRTHAHARTHTGPSAHRMRVGAGAWDRLGRQCFGRPRGRPFHTRTGPSVHPRDARSVCFGRPRGMPCHTVYGLWSMAYGLWSIFTRQALPQLGRLVCRSSQECHLGLAWPPFLPLSLSPGTGLALLPLSLSLSPGTGLAPLPPSLSLTWDWASLTKTRCKQALAPCRGGGGCSLLQPVAACCSLLHEDELQLQSSGAVQSPSARMRISTKQHACHYWMPAVLSEPPTSG
jgi:hypothetical protein